MSLFGIIPIAEIKELAAKCERYIQKFLEDKTEKKDEAEGDEKKEEQPNQDNKPEIAEPEDKDKEMYYEVNNEDPSNMNQNGQSQILQKIV